MATNALLEREGKRTLLVTTKGFANLMTIGDQDRPDIFDLTCAGPALLHEAVVEIDKRVAPQWSTAEEDVGEVVVLETGGMSTDVSQYDSCLEHVTETVVAGVPLQLDVCTMAAGGGSLLALKRGSMHALSHRCSFSTYVSEVIAAVQIDTTWLV